MEVMRLHPRNESEQHRLLSMIERMHREGRSEDEIVATLREAGARAPARADPAAHARCEAAWPAGLPDAGPESLARRRA